MVENGFVLLSDTTFNSQQLINDLQRKWQVIPKDIALKDDSFSFSLGGFFCALSVMPAPIPNGEAEQLAQRNYYCPDAVDIAKRHKAHLMVTIMGQDVDNGSNENHNTAIDGMALYSKIIACALNQNNAIGVYTSGTVFNAEFYRSTCETYLRNVGNIEVPVMIWVFIGLAQTKSGNQLYTIGMEKFDKAEMEILDSKESMQSLLTMLIGICSHVINTNMIMKDGETFGFSAEQQWGISHSASMYARSEYSLKLKVSDLDSIITDNADNLNTSKQLNNEQQNNATSVHRNENNNTRNNMGKNMNETRQQKKNLIKKYLPFTVFLASIFTILTAGFELYYMTKEESMIIRVFLLNLLLVIGLVT